MSKALPTITELKAFEAAARRLSFTEAARDLGLTQAAISFRIKTLEERLGIALFERGNHLLLTDSGQLYLPIAVDVLRRLERGTSRVIAHGARRQRTGTLRLLVTQSVASLWLIPRLASFCEENDGISLSIVSWIGGHSSIVAADFNRHNIDAAILNSRIGTNWNNLEADKIIADCAVPVCGPGLLSRSLPRRHARGLVPADLKHHALIHAQTWPDAWSAWLNSAGASDVEPKDNLWFQHTGLSVQAAMNGLGWAIAHGPLVAMDIQAGRLMAPFRPLMETDFAYFLVHPPQSRELAPVRIFKSWFRSEILRDMKIIEQAA